MLTTIIILLIIAFIVFPEWMTFGLKGGILALLFLAFAAILIWTSLGFLGKIIIIIGLVIYFIRR